MKCIANHSFQTNHSVVQTTDDGSHTLYVPEMDEHYHSTKGALTESRHIFIDMGLKASAANPVHVLEIGFGTGLNAFLTYLESNRLAKEILYSSIEFYPLNFNLLHELNYLQLIGEGHADDYYRLHQAAWDCEVKISTNFTLHKIKGDFTTFPFEKGQYDIIYFDAFAPEKQPEMWSKALFQKLFDSLNLGGILTTYCAKGEVRRTLQSCGFVVERLPGPPHGKREILRAIKTHS